MKKKAVSVHVFKDLCLISGKKKTLFCLSFCFPCENFTIKVKKSCPCPHSKTSFNFRRMEKMLVAVDFCFPFQIFTTKVKKRCPCPHKKGYLKHFLNDSSGQKTREVDWIHTLFFSVNFLQSRWKTTVSAYIFKSVV